MAITRASIGSLRDELLNGEIFYSLAEAKVLIEAWRRHYNTVRPHSSLGYQPPAPESDDTVIAAVRFRFAPPTGGNGGGSYDALTIKPDHSMGADHRCIAGFNPVSRVTHVEGRASLLMSMPSCSAACTSV